MTFWRIAQSAALTCALGAGLGCAAGPNPQLERARSSVAALKTETPVQSYAQMQLDEAERSLSNLERAVRDDKPDSEIEHLAYLVDRRVELARTAASEGELRQRSEGLAERRNELVLEARTRRAQKAEELAQQREGEVAQARDQAAAAEGRSRDADARAQALLGELEELKTKQTQRGLVMTLSGVMFATGQANLQPGAERSLDRVAALLNEYPDRAVSIEGHTDDTGSELVNERLSRERAEVVANYLASQRVARDRIRTRGLGESAPIASNATEAGRQENRRVEIILSSGGTGAGEDPI